jgi:hypothetical protein
MIPVRHGGDRPATVPVQPAAELSERRNLMSRAREDTAPVIVDTPFYRGKAVELGDVTVMFESFPEEQDATPFFRGLPDDRCPCPHWGLVVRGSWTAHYRDHAETFEAGDVFYSPPGHLPSCTAGTELITFSPTQQLHEVMAVVARNIGREEPSVPVGG